MIQGVHLLVIDLFPPEPRDPKGIDHAIWSKFDDNADFGLPPDKRLTVVAYDAGEDRVAYVENVAVGDPLPGMAIFLKPGYYVLAPLEKTNTSAWESLPTPLQRLLAPSRT